jgi:hypothetical protein
MYEKIKEILDDDLYDTTIIDDYYKRGDITFTEYHEAIDKLRTAQAKDIIEIVEKEYGNITNKGTVFFTDGGDNYLTKLEKENELLKSKLINYNPTKQLELEEKINMLKAKCFRLRQTRMAYQSLADKRRDYANHISTTLHKKNLKIKELNQRVAKLEANEVIYHKRLKDIKYLDRDTLRNYFIQFRDKEFNSMDNYVGYLEKLLDEILSLAINKDKLYEKILTFYRKNAQYFCLPPNSKLLERLADEIIKE